MKRRWFQIHLSTALLMMLVAGGILWLNSSAGDLVLTAYDSMGINTTLEEALQTNKEMNHDLRFFRRSFYGWPWRSLVREQYVYARPSGWEPTGTLDQIYFLNYGADKNYGTRLIYVDAAVAITILALTAVFCEYPIRKREARAANDAEVISRFTATPPANS